jgi:hypothetical protein
MQEHPSKAATVVPRLLAAVVIVVAVFGIATMARVFGFIFGVPGIMAVAGMAACAVVAAWVAISRHKSGSRRPPQ